MNKRGFTLLEVLLFMTISAALAAIAFIGLRPRIRNVQFSTGMREIVSYQKSALSGAKLGENELLSSECTASGYSGMLIINKDRPAKSGTQGECVILGKVTTFAKEPANNISEYTLVGRREPPSSLTNCQWQAPGYNPFMACYKPMAANYVSGCDDWNILNGWGARNCLFALPDAQYSFKNGIRMTSPDYVAFGFVIDPATGQRHQFFAFGGSADLVSGSIMVDNPAGSNTACFELSGRKAGLAFSVAKSEPELRFEDPAC